MAEFGRHIRERRELFCPACDGMRETEYVRDHPHDEALELRRCLECAAEFFGDRYVTCAPAESTRVDL